MPSLMFDSDDPSVLAESIFNENRVATYADLLTPALVAKFAGRLVVIDRGHGDPLNLAHVADIEPGALSIDEGVAKVKQWTTEGRRYVTGYVNRSERAAFQAAAAPLTPFVWVATLDGNMDVDDQYTALVQFAPTTSFGLHVDTSIVYHEGWCPLGTMLSVAAVSDLKADAAALAGIAQRVSLAVGAF